MKESYEKIFEDFRLTPSSMDRNFIPDTVVVATTAKAFKADLLDESGCRGGLCRGDPVG